MTGTVVPLDEGPRDRRRVGPFWIEEGTWVVVMGIVILLISLALCAIAWVKRPS